MSQHHKNTSHTRSGVKRKKPIIEPPVMLKSPEHDFYINFDRILDEIGTRECDEKRQGLEEPPLTQQILDNLPYYNQSSFTKLSRVKELKIKFRAVTLAYFHQVRIFTFI